MDLDIEKCPSIIEISPLFSATDEALVLKLQHLGLMSNEQRCPRCKIALFHDKDSLRCEKYRSRFSPTLCSIFAASKMKKSIAFALYYFFCVDLPIYEVEKLLCNKEASRQTMMKWYDKLRETMADTIHAEAFIFESDKMVHVDAAEFDIESPDDQGKLIIRLNSCKVK